MGKKKRKQKRIDYSDVIDLGFRVYAENNIVYENKYGFKYQIINLPLTESLSLDFAKETGRVSLCYEAKNGDFKSVPIMDLEELKKIINLFTK